MIIDLNEEKSKELLRINRLLSIGFSASEVLASHVVVYKTIGLDRELAQVCMKELSRRRSLGEDFDYEQFIEDKIKDFPKMQGLDLTRLGANMTLFKKSILGE